MANSTQTLSALPAYLHTASFPDQTALICGRSSWSYSHLLTTSRHLARSLAKHLPRHHPEATDGPWIPRPPSPNGAYKRYQGQPRVALLCENDATYVCVLWAIWLLRCIAVPLCKVHPSEEQQYVLTDSESSVIVSSRDFKTRGTELARTCGIRHLCVGSLENGELRFGNGESASGNGDSQRVGSTECNGVEEEEEGLSEIAWGNLGAMIVYTSGTTGRPKGVLLTHSNLSAQISMLLEAWEWDVSDTLLHVLPLHHLHGILNALLCPLSCGATVVMRRRFETARVWDSLLCEEEGHPVVTVFTGVPTMYARLLQCYEKAGHTSSRRGHIRSFCTNNIRLMMSGSAALPEPILSRWQDVTGHVLLERYGMTELGMVLSNPISGERIPGTVGNALPSVEVRICPTGSPEPIAGLDGATGVSVGELQVTGPAVFEGYWRKPKETSESFTDDGWFKTGDTASYADGVYRILGRTSVDIIKSGGFKISALEIERVLLEHPDVSDCAVVGVPDDVWGEKVSAVMATETPENLTLPAVQTWCSSRLAPYKMPRLVKTLDTMPRNVVGKVNKSELKKSVFDE